MKTVACALALAVSAVAGENLLLNADFSAWSGESPEGWATTFGATQGEGPASAVRKLEGGVALAGGPGTRRWHVLSQRVALKADATYRLSLEMRGREVRRDEGQFDNAWAGVTLFMKGARGARHVVDRLGPEGTPHQIVFRAGAADEAEVSLVLTKSGTLEFRDLRLEELAVEDSFEVLAAHMARYYSYFELKAVDWTKLTGGFRARAVAASDAEAFADVVTEMLGELRDLHVVVRTPSGRELPTWRGDVKPNADFKAVVRDLAGVEQIGRSGFAGTAAGGYGYVAIGALTHDDATQAKLVAAIEARLEAPGFLVDLRGNIGGSEARAAEIAALFADERRLYAKHRWRVGAGPRDLSEAEERWIAPRAGKRFTKPVVCLVGPACVSSGEGFAKMMKALPHVTLIGQPTRGASGNPSPVELPNGVTVTYSRWVDLMPDETAVEGKGVAPHRVVEHDGAGDPTFRAALELLKEKCRK